MAKKAFLDSIENLAQLDDENYKDQVMILSLIRDNFTLWIQE